MGAFRPLFHSPEGHDRAPVLSFSPHDGEQRHATDPECFTVLLR